MVGKVVDVVVSFCVACVVILDRVVVVGSFLDMVVGIATVVVVSAVVGICVSCVVILDSVVGNLVVALIVDCLTRYS